MEGLSRYRRQLRSLRGTVQKHAKGLQTLGDAIAREGERLGRYDHASRLRVLKSEVMKQVVRLEDMEAAAKAAFSKANLMKGLGRFAIGGLLAVTGNSQDHPLRVGARLSALELRKEAPFGSVVIAVTPGVVKDGKLISVSQLARESGTSESDVKTALMEDGYLLFTPEDFSWVLDGLEHELIEGSISLPAITAELLPSMDQLTQQLKDER